jgi:hypothetical protein
LNGAQRLNGLNDLNPYLLATFLNQAVALVRPDTSALDDASLDHVTWANIDIRRVHPMSIKLIAILLVVALLGWIYDFCGGDVTCPAMDHVIRSPLRWFF